MQQQTSFNFSLTILWLFFAHYSYAVAADFTINNGNSPAASQVLVGNETGTIEADGTISTAVAVGVISTNNNNIINNSGTISTTGFVNFGIYSDGSAFDTITNVGSILTSGLGANSILSTGASTTINNSGIISTNGSGAWGINTGGDDVIVINSGSVSTLQENSNAIVSLGDNASITNTSSGTVSTTLDYSAGIISVGENVTINNNGQISTDGDTTNFGLSSGIESRGGNAAITNSGTISTIGNGSEGIRSSGTNVTINNSNTITTTGNANDFGTSSGITAEASDANINNSGTISTSGFAARGILATSTNAVINNSNTISTTGGANGYGSANGIETTASDAIIKNSGSIFTTGGAAKGILSNGTNSTITNSSVISTTGNSAVGIESTGNDTAVTNNGSISTTNTSAYGIEASGDRSIITNNNSISTAGITASAIESSGDDSIVNNNGSIVSTGDSTASITARGLNTAVNNNGSIAANGDTATGVLSTANNTLINNNGSIRMTGISSNGIFSIGNDSTINNSSLISATGANSYAIIGGSNDITLNLLTGSQIIGRIDLGDDGGDLDIANIYGNGIISTSLTIENTEIINLFGAVGIVVGNNTSRLVTIIDPTIEVTRSVALASLSSSIHSVVSQRMTHASPLKPIQVAALTLSPGMLFQEQQPIAWAQLFGGKRDRDAEGNNLAYDLDHSGFTLGYEWDRDKTLIGLMGGVANSNLETDLRSTETETDSYYIGAYGHFKFDRVNITTSLLGGYSVYENSRFIIDNLNGLEKATADFDGIFISPSVTLSSAFDLNDKVELRPSVSLNYSVAWLDDYEESGSTRSNIDVDKRTISAIAARAQLASAYQFNQHSEIELRLGLNVRHTDDDDVQANLAGSDFRYGNTGDETVSGAYGGINLRIATRDNLSLVADIEYGEASGDEDYLAGQISIEYSF